MHFLSIVTNLPTTQYLAFVGKQSGSLKSEERFSNVLKIHVWFSLLYGSWTGEGFVSIIGITGTCPLKANCGQWYKRNIFFKQVNGRGNVSDEKSRIYMNVGPHFEKKTSPSLQGMSADRSRPNSVNLLRWSGGRYLITILSPLDNDHMLCPTYVVFGKNK